MWYEKPTELDSIFFNNVERFLELTRPTGDENFDRYVKNFYRKNLAQRRAELVKSIRSCKLKYSLLKDFQFNISDYELRVREVNWGFQTLEERERNFEIYNFLCQNSRPSTRKITMFRLEKEYKAAKGEIDAIDSVAENEEFKKHIQNLRWADKFFETISRQFINYAKAHPNAEIVKKYNLPRNFDRYFFETHLEEIKLLKKPKEYDKE